MNFKTRSYQKELLDGEGIPFADIAQTMRELNTINTLLGGHAITLEGFKKLAKDKKEITVCEIGCGGGDNLVAIVNYCKANEIKIHCIGIDFICSDYSKVYFENKPDIIFSSLFCHHFTDEALVFQLKWMTENTEKGFFINDLQRHWLAYYLIKILTNLFSNSYLVKNDACLSVARGFIKSDWKNIFSKSGIENYKISWKWAFRYLIVKEQGL